MSLLNKCYKTNGAHLPKFEPAKIGLVTKKAGFLIGLLPFALNIVELLTEINP